MLAAKLFGSGLNSQSVISIGQDVALSLTATGTNQATAYPVTTSVAWFSTVASGTGAVLSSTATSGDSQTLYNSGANALKVYPPTGGKINQAATNAAVMLATNTGCEFTCLGTQWFGNLSA